MFSMGPFLLGWKSSFGNIKLPFYCFYVLTPVFNGIRDPSRFQYLFYFPFCIFSAFGTSFIFKKLRKRSFFLTGLLMVILTSIVVENYNVKSFRQKSYILGYLSGARKKKFSFLKNQTTFHYPTFEPLIQNNKFLLEAVYLNWDTVTGETMMNGYSGYFPIDWTNILGQFRDNLGKESLKKMKILGIHYVIIHKNLLSSSSFQKLWLDHGKLYEKGMIYNGQNTLILNLNRYYFKYHLCHFHKDFLYEGMHVYAINGQPSYYKLIVRNAANCYLASPFNKRYFPLNFTIGGEKYHSYLKFPLLIDPYKKVELYGYFSPIKNDIKAIKKFTTSLQFSHYTQQLRFKAKAI